MRSPPPEDEPVYCRAITPAKSDTALIEAAQTNDRAAADELLRRHFDLIYAVCRKLAGNDADAADATQEAMIAIVKGLPRYDGRAAFTTWAYRVATNACLDELRRRKRRPDSGLPEHETAALEPVRTMSATSAGEVDELVSDRLDVNSALAELPEEFRAPLVLRDLVGMDYAEIAETLDIPPGTVRSRIARARRRLHDSSALAGNQPPAPDRPNPVQPPDPNSRP